METDDYAMHFSHTSLNGWKFEPENTCLNIFKTGQKVSILVQNGWKSPKTASLWGNNGLFSKSAFPSLIRRRRIRVCIRCQRFDDSKAWRSQKDRCGPGCSASNIGTHGLSIDKRGESFPSLSYRDVRLQWSCLWLAGWGKDDRSGCKTWHARTFNHAKHRHSPCFFIRRKTVA